MEKLDPISASASAENDSEYSWREEREDSQFQGMLAVAQENQRRGRVLDEQGGPGGNVIDQDSGNQVLRGGRRTDHLHGGAGDDIIRGGRGADVLFGYAGNDTIRGGRGRDYIDGGDGDDVLLGGRGDDILYGGQGNDQIFGGRGMDTAQYAMGQEHYSITVNEHGAEGDTWLTADVRNNTTGSVDKLTNVELLRFNDGSVIDLRTFIDEAPAPEVPDGPEMPDVPEPPLSEMSLRNEDGSLNQDYFRTALEYPHDPEGNFIEGGESLTDMFEGSSFNSARELTAGEREALMQTAEALDAAPANLALLADALELFPPTISFVDGLTDATGDTSVLGLALGEANVPGALNIVMDSSLMDADFDDGVVENSIELEGESAARTMLHEFTHVLQAFGIVPNSGEAGDSDYEPELAAGVPVTDLDMEDQAEWVEDILAPEFLEDENQVADAPGPVDGSVYTDADLPSGDGFAIVSGDATETTYQFSGQRPVGVDYSNSGDGMVLNVEAPELSTGTATGDTFQNVFGITTTAGDDHVTLSQVPGGDGPSDRPQAIDLGSGSDYIVDGWGYNSIQLGDDMNEDIVVASLVDDLPPGVYGVNNSTAGEAALGRPSYNDLYDFDFANDQLDLSAFGLSGFLDPNLAVTSDPAGWIEIRVNYDDGSTRQIFYINTADLAALNDPIGSLQQGLVF